MNPKVVQYNVIAKNDAVQPQAEWTIFRCYDRHTAESKARKAQREFVEKFDANWRVFVFKRFEPARREEVCWNHPFQVLYDSRAVFERERGLPVGDERWG